MARSARPLDPVSANTYSVSSHELNAVARNVPAEADKAGKLDIASLNLESLPSTVFTALLGIPAGQLSRPPPSSAEDTDTIIGLASSISTNLQLEGKGTREQAFGSKPREEEWSEPEELTSLKADHNLIREIDVEVGAFGGLKVLDVSHSILTRLAGTWKWIGTKQYRQQRIVHTALAQSAHLPARYSRRPITPDLFESLHQPPLQRTSRYPAAAQA